ncbi:hypothetical protein HOY82DRAFT_647186 [Tuber indicum]|nr:hypothetical protein HOY82DRAFT_647186 [Tuber indicum]
MTSSGELIAEISPSFLLKFGPNGSWALITGTADGIGTGFSPHLAPKRLTVKLATLAVEIELKHSGIETKTLTVDSAKYDAVDYERLRALLKEMDIAILITNVGTSHDIPVPFLERAEKEMDDIITIHVNGTLKVTPIVAPGMVSRKRGLIFTMGLFGGLLPTPFLATYSGSRDFLPHWRDGVQVQLAVGYLITIGFQGTAAGMEGTITPYWSHGLMHLGVQELLGIWNYLVLNKNLGMHTGIRKRALR